MKGSNTFGAYRFFIVPSEQISFFDVVEEKRKHAVEEYFQSIEINKKVSYEINRRKHIIVFNRKIGTDIYILKFSMEKSETLYKEGEQDIENIVEPNLPFVYLVVDIKRQILLIELKTNVFSSINTAKNKIQKCFQTVFSIYAFQVIIEEISDGRTFWSFVQEAQGVYGLSIKLNSPNLFGGFNNTDDMLRDINNTYNNTETKIELSNEKPKLHLKKANKLLSSAIDYASGGAGEWEIVVQTKQGEKKTYRSKHNIKKVNVKAIDNGDNVSQTNAKIISALDSVEDVLVDKKEKRNEVGEYKENHFTKDPEDPKQS